MALIHLKTLFLLAFALQITTLLHSQNTDSIRVVPLRERGPEYPDGQAAMHQFIAKNLRYSKNDTCVRGHVFVNFCIETDGSISRILVQKGLCKTYDAEAMRVISIMPKWKPALEYGTKKPVKSYFTVSCRFKWD